jgi:hypothetical protein
VYRFLPQLIDLVSPCGTPMSKCHKIQGIRPTRSRPVILSSIRLIEIAHPEISTEALV